MADSFLLTVDEGQSEVFLHQNGKTLTKHLFARFRFVQEERKIRKRLLSITTTRLVFNVATVESLSATAQHHRTCST